MLPQHSTRHRVRRERRQRRLAAWIFLLACVVLFLGMVFFGPDQLPLYRHRALGITYSVFVGVGVYFFTGSTLRIADSNMPAYCKAGLCLFFALTAGAAVFGVWEMGLSPIGREAAP